MILAIRTDKPEAEISLYDGQKQLANHVWHAHRQLAETLHTTIAQVLGSHNKALPDLTGIVVYQGPGSFTGLRIGMSVANTLAYALGVPIAGATGDNWATDAIQSLQNNPTKLPIQPEYGAPANVTLAKK
jgi:tRNA threonylcarbamoyladenosine biosynthesis protein TsaB